MKKLSVFLVAALLCACGQSGKNQSSQTDSTSADTAAFAADSAAPQPLLKMAAPAADDSVSLSGVPKTDAGNMIKDFYANSLGKLTPKKEVSVWFKASDVKGMYDVLTKDRSLVEGDKVGKTDGFRVYFVSQSANKNELSVILVATKYAGNEKGSNTRLHADYYHDKKSSASLGQANYGDRKTGDCDGGAQVYKPCADCGVDVDCQVAPTHRVSRKFAQSMVSKFGVNPINTRSVWFSYELLQSLVSSSLLKNMTGIRIYYGNYGDTDSSGKTRSAGDDHKNRDTFILMPTVASKNTAGRNIDLDKIDCLPKGGNKAKTLEDPTGGGDGGYNNGEICPSHCNEREGEGR